MPLDYWHPGEIGDDADRLVLLCRLPLFEANLARAKLDSEGIPAVLHDANMAITYSPLVGDVPLMVHAVDLERARAILATRSRVEDEDDVGADADENDDIDTDRWRCSKCGERKVDLLPLPPHWRSVRRFCGVAVLLLFAQLLGSLLFGSKFPSIVETDSAIYWTAFALLASVIAFITVTVKRTKCCRECGHEWVN